MNRSKQLVQPLRINSTADSCAHNARSSWLRPRFTHADPARNVSRIASSGTAPRANAPCEWVCPLTRPGIIMRPVASNGFASATVSPVGRIAAIRSWSISNDTSAKWSFSTRTCAPWIRVFVICPRSPDEKHAPKRKPWRMCVAVFSSTSLRSYARLPVAGTSGQRSRTLRAGAQGHSL